MADKSERAYQSPYGPPCPPLHVDWTEILKLPQLYINFQPYDLQQYSPRAALRRGTLWPALFSAYHNPYENPGGGAKK
ncbi:MAG TPA: spore coat associated protein CotJA [Bacillales bacterium]